MSAMDDIGRVAERFAPQACRRSGAQALRRCLSVNPGCVSDDWLERLARAGDLSKLRLALALGPQRSPETLARALSMAHHFIPSPRRRRLAALALFAAAGPQRSEVARRALALQLRYGYPEGLGALFDAVDFSLPAPNGASWAWDLARFDPQGSPTLRRLVEQAFRKAWDAMPDKSIQAAGEHAPLAFLAAESGNVCALAAMEGWVDFDALHKGSSLLETALFSRREDAFEFLMPRSLPQADRFGRDAFGRALWALAKETAPHSFRVWTKASSMLEIWAQASNPSLIDALGESSLDWARQANLPGVERVLRARLLERFPAQRPLDPRDVDEAILAKISKLCLGHRYEKDPAARMAIQIEAIEWGAKLSHPRARDGMGRGALHWAAFGAMDHAVAVFLSSDDPLSLDRFGITPLASLCAGGSGPGFDQGALPTLRLLARPASASIASDDGNHPLANLACWNGPLLAIGMEAFDLLAPISPLELCGARALDAAAAQPDMFERVWSWTGAAAPGWARPVDGAQAWPERLAREGQVSSLVRAAKQGVFGAAGLLARKAEGRGLLSWAAEGESSDAARELLGLGLPMEPDEDGFDPLMRALLSKRAKVASLLIPLADLSRRDALGFRAIDHAKAWGEPDIIHAIAERMRSAKESRQLRRSIPPSKPPSAPARL